MRRKPGERENANARTWGDACAPRLQPRSATSHCPTHAPGPLQGTLPGPANELLGLTRRSCRGGEGGDWRGRRGTRRRLLRGGRNVSAALPAGAGFLLPTRFLAGPGGPRPGHWGCLAGCGTAGQGCGERSLGAPGALPCPFHPGAVAGAQLSFASSLCRSPVLVHRLAPEPRGAPDSGREPLRTPHRRRCPCPPASPPS